MGKIIAEFNAEEFDVDGKEGLSVIQFNGKTMVLFGKVRHKFEIIDGNWCVYNNSTSLNDEMNHE